MGTRLHQKPSGSPERRIGNHFRLAVAKDLARIYSDVLHDPIPQNLRQLLTRLETKAKDPSAR